MEDREESLEERMNRLDADLAARSGGDGNRDGQSEESRSGYRAAVKISSEFISAVVVGALLGYLLDKFAGTWPWGLVVFLMLGFVAGVLNVLRTAGVVKTPHPVDKLRTMNSKNKEK